jgi:hypothetical protein
MHAGNSKFYRLFRHGKKELPNPRELEKVQNRRNGEEGKMEKKTILQNILYPSFLHFFFF